MSVPVSVSLNGVHQLDFSNATAEIVAPGVVEIDIAGSGGGGSPGGLPTQVQYNNAGSFGGITKLTSDGTDVYWTTSATFALATDSSGKVITATRSGNTSTIATTSGVLTAGHLASFDASGNIIDGGSIPSAGVTSVTGDGALINNVSSTGAVTLTLGNATKYQFWGRNAGTTGTPGYFNLPISTFALATDGDGQIIAATRSGNTATLGTTSGVLTNGHLAAFDASGNIVDGGSPTGGTVTNVTGVFPVASTGGATPAISLQNSALVNLTAAYGTNTAYFTASGGVATNGHVIVGDAQGGIKDSGKTLVSLTNGTIGVTVDGGGAVPATGFHGYIQVPYDCTITGWTMLANAAGSAQVTVKKSDYSGFPSTSSIVAGAPPNIPATNQKNTSTTLTGWTTTITAGDVIEFNLDSVTTITWLILQLQVTKT